GHEAGAGAVGVPRRAAAERIASANRIAAGLIAATRGAGCEAIVVRIRARKAGDAALVRMRCSVLTSLQSGRRGLMACGSRVRILRRLLVGELRVLVTTSALGSGLILVLSLDFTLVGRSRVRKQQTSADRESAEQDSTRTVFLHDPVSFSFPQWGIN